MGLKQILKQEFKMKSICTTKKRRQLIQVESNVTNLVGTISNISITWPTTFRRRHHSPSYSIFCASMWGLYSNVIFPWDSQVGIPKLKLLLSKNFECSYLSQIKSFLEMKNNFFIALKRIFPMVYNTPQLELI
jgi:hypothetical protein